MNQLRKWDENGYNMDLIARYRSDTMMIKAEILNLASFDRDETINMIQFYKQMLVSTRTLAMKDYITLPDFTCLFDPTNSWINEPPFIPTDLFPHNCNRFEIHIAASVMSKGAIKNKRVIVIITLYHLLLRPLD